MTTLEVFVPSGATEILQLHAPRLKSLNGKTVGFVSNDQWQAPRTLPLVAELMEREVDNLKTIPYTEFPIGNLNIDSDETIEHAKKLGVDAIVIGNAA